MVFYRFDRATTRSFQREIRPDELPYDVTRVIQVCFNRHSGLRGEWHASRDARVLKRHDDFSVCSSNLANTALSLYVFNPGTQLNTIITMAAHVRWTVAT
jgi:hypothetical protein